MISPKEALEKVLQYPFVPKPETISFRDCAGRILDGDIVVEEPIPPFDRVAMDGIAVSSADPILRSGILISAGVQAAGDSVKLLPGNGYCLEVMTGAVCPDGADSIVPYEHIEKTETGFRLIQPFREKGQNIHHKGSDRKVGEILLRSGSCLGPVEIGALASTGNVQVKVKSRPRVVLFSSGNELVDPQDGPKPYQIRRSNVYLLESFLAEMGIHVKHLHVNDDRNEISDVVSSALKNFDVLLFSGAVSKGKYDFLPGVLHDLGVENIFHGVSQRPGKPFWFGRKDEKVVFAFPGNPVSSLVCTLMYFHPWWFKSFGIHAKRILVRIQGAVIPHPELTLYMQIKLSGTEGGIQLAKPVTGHGSGDYTSLLEADGFVEIPPSGNPTNPSDLYPVYLFRNVL